MSPDCLSKMDEERERIAQTDPDPLQTVLAAHLAAAFRRGATFDHAVETFLEVCGDGTPDAEVWRLARMWAQGREAVGVEVHAPARETREHTVLYCGECPDLGPSGPDAINCGLLVSSVPRTADGRAPVQCPLRKCPVALRLAEGM